MIDLKEVKERHLNDLACGHFILDMIAELEAAREVVAAARFVLEEADPRYTEDFTPSQAKLSESLKTYDEARRG